jgi:hypothetical protein
MRMLHHHLAGLRVHHHSLSEQSQLVLLALELAVHVVEVIVVIVAVVSGVNRNKRKT